jgi:hypothetical protein
VQAFQEEARGEAAARNAVREVLGLHVVTGRRQLRG